MVTRRTLIQSGLTLVVSVGTKRTFVVARPSIQDSTIRIAVSPALISLEATPGATGEQEITVRNDGNVSFDVRAVVSPYANAPEAASATSWILVEPEVIPLEPGAQETFTVQIAVPDGVATGSYFARVSFTTESAGAGTEGQAEGQGVVAVAGAVAVPIVFTVEGDEPLRRSVHVERIVPFLEPDGRLGFRAELVNDGNIHTRLSGQVGVFGPDGSALAALEFPDQTLLPGQTQVVRATGTLPLPMDSEYTAQARFLYGPDDDQQELTDETTFTFAEVQPPSMSLSMCENLDRGPTLTIRLSNESGIGQVPQVALRLQQAESMSTLTATRVPNDLALWPQDEVEIVTDLPTRLETGRYALQAQVSVGGGEPAVTEYPFEIGGNSPETIPLCSLLPATTPMA